MILLKLPTDQKQRDAPELTSTLYGSRSSMRWARLGWVPVFYALGKAGLGSCLLCAGQGCVGYL